MYLCQQGNLSLCRKSQYIHTNYCVDYLFTNTDDKIISTNLAYNYKKGKSSNAAVNVLSMIVVCNVGYYKNGNDCEMCTGNTIKSTPGDAVDCNGDTLCDGVTEVPDANHTNCGLYSIFF